MSDAILLPVPGAPLPPRYPILNGGRRWWMVGRTTVGSNPWASVGTSWCHKCLDETDTDTEAHYGDGTYVYRRRCNRCGSVTSYGACRAELVCENPLPPKALIWTVEPGRDRR